VQVRGDGSVEDSAGKGKLVIERSGGCRRLDCSQHWCASMTIRGESDYQQGESVERRAAIGPI